VPNHPVVEPSNPSAPDPAGCNSAVPIDIDYVNYVSPHNVDYVLPTNNKTPYADVEVCKQTARE
jgi:hypothetical protein